MDVAGGRRTRFNYLYYKFRLIGKQSRRVEDCLLKDPSLREDQSFSVLDENGDGRISKTEIARAYRLAGFNPTKGELESIVKEHDEN
ncbi:hypothetical protein MAR_031863, partial [Mya arenaria]